jgi:hypothetical protein
MTQASGDVNACIQDRPIKLRHVYRLREKVAYVIPYSLRCLKTMYLVWPCYEVKFVLATEGGKECKERQSDSESCYVCNDKSPRISPFPRKRVMMPVR